MSLGRIALAAVLTVAFLWHFLVTNIEKGTGEPTWNPFEHPRESAFLLAALAVGTGWLLYRDRRSGGDDQ